MNILNKFRKAVQQSKIVRYKTYKKINCVGHRELADRIFLNSLLFLVVGGAFILFKPTSSPVKETPNIEVEQAYVNPDAVEVVHEEFADDPVIEEKTLTTISDLEYMVTENEASLKTYTLKKDETFEKLLVRSGIDKIHHQSITQTFSLLLDLNKLKIDTLFLVFVDNNKSFLGLVIPAENGEVRAALMQEDGSITPFTQAGQVETKQERIKVKIDRTFNGSAQNAGVPAEIIKQITHALSDEFDFRSSMRRGDTFDIIYNKKVTSTGLDLDFDQELLFVGLESKTRSVYKYAYKDKSGITAFYNPQGQRGQQTLLQRPVQGVARLSSSYGYRRHPVLMYRLFHSGVDLAAPRGRPIFAAADGVITHIGTKGAYGKYIKIKHQDSFQTAYGHMSGFKKGLKRGSRVKKGEIIAYIGATGRATGPHLHFEVWKNGKTKNPLHKHIITGYQLRGFEMEQFKVQAESIHPDYLKHLFGKTPPIPPKKPLEFK